MAWGVNVKEITSSNYFIAHSLDRGGSCVYREKGDGISSTYCGGPYKGKEEAERFIETFEAIDG